MNETAKVTKSLIASRPNRDELMINFFSHIAQQMALMAGLSDPFNTSKTPSKVPNQSSANKHTTSQMSDLNETFGRDESFQV